MAQDIDGTTIPGAHPCADCGTAGKRRDLTWVREDGTLGEALGVSQERAAELDRFVGDMVDRGATLREIVEAVNDRGDLTDSEWTSFMYGVGWYTCKVRGGV